MGINDGIITRVVNIAMTIKLRSRRSTLGEILKMVNVQSIDRLYTMSRIELIEVEKSLLDLKKNQA